VSLIYWQTKIWALLHDPALKALSSTRDLAREGQWELLSCMDGWRSPKPHGKESGDCQLHREWLKYVGLCDLIASASDRSTIGRLDPSYSSISYQPGTGLEISHLLSGKHQDITINPLWEQNLNQQRREFLEAKESEFLNQIKDWQEPEKVFWALWRCYPQVLENQEPLVHLLPAETRLPDGSLWSHVSMTSALAGGLAGYYQTVQDYPKKGKSFDNYSRPYLVNFTFSPVQELIKASRKMRDFWAGSWILHYLSAKVAWKLALKYGADTLLYPCLYQQPLIDHWLLAKYPDFEQWIKQPEAKQLLTAGFPNVIVMLLPNNGKDVDTTKDNPIYGAMQYAKQVLLDEWKQLGNQSLEYLQSLEKWSKYWQNINPSTWEYWLKAQWQTYWTAFPIGDPNADLTCSLRVVQDRTKAETEQKFQDWVNQQNSITNLTNPRALFETNEEKFLKQIFQLTEEDETKAESKTKYSKQPNLNTGSWWAFIFDQLRLSLNSVKNARNWMLPTAFSTRSTISGLGSSVHPLSNSKNDWTKESELNEFWSQQFGLFDGSEKPNATEIVKRVLHKILPEILNYNESQITPYYPDLTAGVAGYLKTGTPEDFAYFKKVCSQINQKILADHHQIPDSITLAWGIPYIDENPDPDYHSQNYHPRFLNAGWLVEDLEINQLETKRYREELYQTIAQYYPNNNPTDWYILCAGDGDGMNEWLKGTKLKNYSEYLPDTLREKIESDDSNIPQKYKQPLRQFLKVTKRMGPATHSSLSRALLDFSNQLVPYLTEERYAGRLIYSGGDDVLAYTNLWEWDSWLWDIRQCFRGQNDPSGEFDNAGDYWQYQGENQPKSLAKRPLFTMGSEATISFGIVIAHHSVPLAISLENLWEAEEEAKEHEYFTDHYHNHKPCYAPKDAVQVRVIYSNGNLLKSTAKFEVFHQWQQLLEFGLDSAIFEQAAQLLEAHPIPIEAAIEQWVKAFCLRREKLKLDEQKATKFQQQLSQFFQSIWQTNQLDPSQSQKEIKAMELYRDQQLINWLKITAFVIRNRQITLGHK
jgi:CRISPR-associated protein Cmr2